MGHECLRAGARRRTTPIRSGDRPAMPAHPRRVSLKQSRSTERRRTRQESPADRRDSFAHLRSWSAYRKSLGVKPRRLNLYAVPGRVGKKKHLNLSRADEVRTLALIVALAMIPGGGTVAVIALTTQPDLNELTPVASHTAGFSLLSWESLLRDQPHALDARSAIASGAAVEVLGYVMDGNRTLENGERMQEFTLLPEAGSPIHPAHRFGDQMIDVHLRDDARFRFSPHTLVWVRGSLQSLSGDPTGDKPLYTIEQAHAERAGRGAIRKYFR
jgi:hypothetical protein